ncbi:MAG TPA: alanine/glycine:cation symporter family protein [Steroidobacteraceae bacterium]|nr:alanine/glycine:cation symporter family protein [Steroidobacteraceae bacterium]
MNVDQTINEWVAPIAHWLGKVVFYALPIGATELPLILVWLIMGGVICTLAFRFVNLRGFRHSAQVIRGDYSSPSHSGEATPFQALSTAVSGTVGLGAIGGVAVAVSLGGPGAAFWMVVAGFLGMSTKFAEVTLAVKYRTVREDGTVSGGAMYYLPVALGRVGLPRLGKFLAGFFCVAAVGGSLTIFQVNQAYAQFHAVTGFDQAFLFGLIVAVWIGIVLFGGVRRIVKWTDKLSPFMCLLYVVACVVVLGANYAGIPGALATIVREAFVPDAVAGGLVGALIQGFRRAAFANEAGLGSAPMAHATVRTNEPMSQGFAALMEPFLDTVIICLLTALVVVVSGVYQTSPSEGIALTSDAFATVVPWFPAVLAVVAILFALSTVLSWGYYGEQAWTWLFSGRQVSRVAYRLFLCSVLSVAATLNINQVVNIVDSLNFCMAIPNLIAVYLLLPELRADLASYWQRVVLKSGTGKTHDT